MHDNAPKCTIAAERLSPKQWPGRGLSIVAPDGWCTGSVARSYDALDPPALTGERTVATTGRGRDHQGTAIEA